MALTSRRTARKLNFVVVDSKVQLSYLATSASDTIITIRTKNTCGISVSNALPDYGTGSYRPPSAAGGTGPGGHGAWVGGMPPLPTFPGRAAGAALRLRLLVSNASINEIADSANKGKEGAATSPMVGPVGLFLRCPDQRLLLVAALPQMRIYTYQPRKQHA